MTLHLTPYKTGLLALVLGSAVVFGVPQVFGGGGGGSGGDCGNCGTTVGSTDAGNSFEDRNGNGRPDPGEPANAMGGGGGGGGNGTIGNLLVPRPQPRPCTLTLGTTLIASGTPSVALSWAPAPGGNVALRRSRLGGGRDVLPVSAKATTYTDTTSSLRVGTYTYIVSYSRGVRYACTATLTVVDAITECNDRKDNGDSEDALLDQQDPGCHTDGNPTNINSYDSKDTTEANSPPNLKGELTITHATPTTIPRNDRFTLNARAVNQSATYAPSNRLSIGYRRTSDTATTCSSFSNIFRRCFVLNGRAYTVAGYTGNATYLENQSRTLSRVLRLDRTGTYEFCAFADSERVVSESSETDNGNCTLADIVTTTVLSAPPPPVFTPLNFEVTPSIIRSGQTSMLAWDTGGRTACTITGSNGHTIDLSDSSQAVGSEATPAIVAQSTYKMTCTDPGALGEETATIRIIPSYQEL